MSKNLITVDGNSTRVEKNYFLSILEYIREKEIPEAKDFQRICAKEKTEIKVVKGSILSQKLLELVVTLTQPEGNNLEDFLRTLYSEAFKGYIYNRDSCVVIQWEEIAMLMAASGVRSKNRLSTIRVDDLGQIESFFLSGDSLNISTIIEEEKGTRFNTINVYNVE